MPTYSNSSILLCVPDSLHFHLPSAVLENLLIHYNLTTSFVEERATMQLCVPQNQMWPDTLIPVKYSKLQIQFTLD